VKRSNEAEPMRKYKLGGSDRQHQGIA